MRKRNDNCRNAQRIRLEDSRQESHNDRARPLDPRVVAFVKFLARRAAEDDFREYLRNGKDL